jgi:hypothetical protein
MGNFIDKSCRENQNTHFMFSNFFFSKILGFMRWYRRMWWSQRGHKSYVRILRIRVAFLISKATCTHAHSHSHAPGNTHARAHIHTNIFIIIIIIIIIFIAFPQQQWFADASQCCHMRTLSVLFWSKCRLEKHSITNRNLLKHTLN